MAEGVDQAVDVTTAADILKRVESLFDQKLGSLKRAIVDEQHAEK